MFGTSNNQLKEEIQELKYAVQDLTERMIDLKVLLVDVRIQTLGNRVAITKDKNPVKEVIKEITVTRARKKPRERIRKTEGGKRITQAEINEMIKLFDQGLSYTEISGMTGRSASSISTKIYEHKKTEEIKEKLRP